jgi:general stress protein 26
MSTLKEQIAAIITPLQLSSVATIADGGKPWVRYVMTMGRDDLSVRFATFARSRKVAQIAANPEVHVTLGCSDPAVMTPYLQIQGRARFSTVAEERHGFWSEMLANYFSGPDDPNYGVVIVTPYRIELAKAGEPAPEVWTAV